MELVEKIKLFAELTDQERQKLWLFCQEKFVPAWEKIFSQGDEANAMYILADGVIEISNSINGEKVVLWEVRAEEILGEMALFWEQSTRMATATALKNSVLLTILSFSIKELTLQHPQLLEKIKWIIEERTLNNRIIETEIKS